MLSRAAEEMVPQLRVIRSWGTGDGLFCSNTQLADTDCSVSVWGGQNQLGLHGHTGRVWHKKIIVEIL